MDYEQKLSNLLNRMISCGIVKNNNFSGIDGAQLRALESLVGNKLPNVFRQFLAKFGNDTKYILSEAHLLSYSELIDEIEIYNDCLIKNEINFKLGKNTLIFYDYSQVDFCYFHCDGENDPTVYRIFNEDEQPVNTKISLSEFLLKRVESIINERIKIT